MLLKVCYGREQSLPVAIGIGLLERKVAGEKFCVQDQLIDSFLNKSIKHSSVVETLDGLELQRPNDKAQVS